MLSIDDLQSTWPLLKLLCDNEAQFPNITGLHLTYDAKHDDLVRSIPLRLLQRCRKLSLIEKAESTTFIHTTKLLLSRTSGLLTHLSIMPRILREEYVHLLVVHSDKLGELRNLNISSHSDMVVGKSSDKIRSKANIVHFEFFKYMQFFKETIPCLSTLRIDQGDFAS